MRGSYDLSEEEQQYIVRLQEAIETSQVMQALSRQDPVVLSNDAAAAATQYSGGKEWALACPEDS